MFQKTDRVFQNLKERAKNVYLRKRIAPSCILILMNKPRCEKAWFMPTTRAKNAMRMHAVFSVLFNRFDTANFCVRNSKALDVLRSLSRRS